MRKTLALLLLFVLTGSLKLFSQAYLTPTVIDYTNATSSGRAPNGTSGHTSMRAHLILAPNELTELPAGIAITKLGFSLVAGVNTPANGQFRVFLQNTSDATNTRPNNWPSATAGMTQVYYGNYALPVVPGKTEVIIDLDVPFTYNGEGLYVAYEYSGVNFSSSPATYNCNTDIISGCKSSSSSTTTQADNLGITNFRPLIILGFENPYINDLAVTSVKPGASLYSPVLGGPNKIKAVVKNSGAQLQTNIPVSWVVAGTAYSGSFSSNITHLAPGDSTEVEITIPNATTGILQVTASVDPDERNSNNSSMAIQTIVCDELRYANETSYPDAIGFATTEGIIGVKYQSPATSITVSAIKIRLSNNTPSIGNKIKGVVLDANGVILASSPEFSITSANLNTEVSIALSAPVTIPANENFYSGLLQIRNSTVGYFPLATTLPLKLEPGRNFTFAVTGGAANPITENLGQLLIGFSAQPIVTLTTPVTGTLKYGQTATFTATPGFSSYEFSVNNVVKQTSAANTFTYVPKNNEIVSVSGLAGGCSSPAGNTITMQVDEIVPTNGVVYVKKGSSGNGSSWANAAGELADVLLAAGANTSIQQIWIAGGKYLPAYSSNDTNKGVSDGRNNSFVIPANIKIYGGFAGTETNISQRNLSITANKTILSGDLDANDNANGAIAGNNAYHVMMATGSGTFVLDGVSIIGGNADNDQVDVNSNGVTVVGANGAALYSYNQNLQLNNVIIQGNQAIRGAGIFTQAAPVTVSNSVIAGNKADKGAGIASFGSQLTVINTCITGNNAISTGGAMHIENVNPVIINSIIYGNNSGIFGLTGNITYSILQQTITGTGNAETDPLFENMPSFNSAPFIGGDYRLKLNSPGINTGSNAAIQTLPAAMRSTDIISNTRIIDQANGGIVDIGPYELQVQPQTITATDLNKVYGDADFIPGATASSGLIVAYASSNNNIAAPYQDAADGNKWKIKVKAAGTVTITASQAGNGSYFPAPDKTFNLSIAAKPVTVQLTSASITKVYNGNTNGTLALANLALAAGSVVGSDNLELNISSTAFSYDNKNVGTNKQVTFPLSAVSLAGTNAANYSIANITAITANIGVITPATLSVTAEAKTKVYGQSDPALTYTYSGFATGDAASFTGALSRNPGEDAGNYAILQNNLSAGTNYSIQFNSANLTISKAPQTISWTQDLLTGCNGVAPITLTATASSGLQVSYQSANTNIATVNAQTLTPVHEGATSITATQAGDINHEPATAVVKNFSYQLSSALRQHFPEVLLFNNSGGNYVQWQWYKNGNQVAGSNSPYYTEPTALNGTYYVTVTDKNGNAVQTCPITLNGSNSTSGTVKVSPNPAKAGSTVSIACNYSETALQGASLQISGIGGTVVQRITNVRPVNTVVMPSAGGLYIITLTLANGQQASVNVLVN